jgi:hypothetical protein
MKRARATWLTVAQTLAILEGSAIVVAAIASLAEAKSAPPTGAFGNGFSYVQATQIPLSLIVLAVGGALVIAGIGLRPRPAAAGRAIVAVQVALLAFTLYLMTIGFVSAYSVLVVSFAVLLFASLRLGGARTRA